MNHERPPSELCFPGRTYPKDDAEEPTAKEAAERALSCLYIAVDAAVAGDVNKTVKAYISHLEQENERLEEWKKLLESAPGKAAEVIRERALDGIYFAPIVNAWKAEVEKLQAELVTAQGERDRQYEANASLITAIAKLEAELAAAQQEKQDWQDAARTNCETIDMLTKQRRVAEEALSTARRELNDLFVECPSCSAGGGADRSVKHLRPTCDEKKAESDRIRREALEEAAKLRPENPYAEGSNEHLFYNVALNDFQNTIRAKAIRDAQGEPK